MATASEHCTLVVAGQPHPDLALVANGLLGLELLQTEETSNQGIVTENANTLGVQVTACVFSSLGTAQEQTPAEIRTKCPKDQVGVLLYCIEVNGLGFDSNGVREGMNKITLAYGADIWKNALIVFLKANRCAAAFNDAGSPRESFRRQRQTWLDQVIGIMMKIIATTDGKKIVRKMNSVVAGNEDELSLPGEEFWLSSLWKMVSEKSTKVFKKGLSSLTLQRVKKRDEMRRTRDNIRAQRIWEQPICSTALPLKLKILLGVGGPAILGAGIAGATTGALIGALAIGIPTFGVAAGAGLVIGAVVGGGIGVGVAGAATGGAAAYQKSQEEKMQDEMYAQQVAHQDDD